MVEFDELEAGPDPSLFYPLHVMKSHGAATPTGPSPPAPAHSPTTLDRDWAALSIKAEVEDVSISCVASPDGGTVGVRSSDDDISLRDRKVGAAAMDPEARRQLSIERRRKRNREAMQRSRQRDKDHMDGLRRDAARLESIYNKLMEQMNERLASSNPEQCELRERLEAARRQAQELMEENLRFQETITERIKGEDRMEGLLRELIKDHERNSHALRAILFDTIAPRMTEDRAMELIMKSRKTRICLEKKKFAAIEQSYNFFGWHVRHCFLNRSIYFTFSKVFRNQSAEELHRRAWKHEVSLKSYRPPSEKHAHCRQMLQRINENTFISSLDRPDLEHPGEFVRRFDLRFSVKEPDGVYAVAYTNVPYEEFMKPIVDHMWANEVCIWTKFMPLQECDVASGDLMEHCIVRFVGKAAIGQVADAQANALELVMCLARWENANIGPALRLTQ
ncbi:hypothetical protein P43SY_001175 [Pythium insidiosum]|uniref:BZIP domain-containing protein n=1 Tax=Pythium insidiosum TaxID=114742 RepID=A0AAD5Q954_PYTIN|nr:hypothetical protein P43SY_001175 [Pythium insidiosum]KAJ0402421.1 hypothetical protein ATCC90586_000019 [Pythium insidiosum]